MADGDGDSIFGYDEMFAKTNSEGDDDGPLTAATKQADERSRLMAARTSAQATSPRLLSFTSQEAAEGLAQPAATI